ncbi:related to RNA-dependent RNA polymerase (involved in quelling) [Phialocephala subalpina]|uniref:RNA-dependent RNA polymerase n=1 Tax=Phialocephala subalpina TaxID=576137 RepID=A0A1L7XF50_9HELO|nr:related to RNA-dependent RNA polymerase (involved in quelling) [Phialocephala subalpina]
MAPSTEFSASETTASRERKIKNTKDTIKSIVQSLCYRWAFDLKIPEQESPSSRENSTLEQQCVIMIIGIGWKDKPALIDVAEQFENEAYAKWRGWVNKPKAERGTVPEKTRHRPCPVSDEERGQLLDCLHQRLSAAWEPIKKQKTPKRFIPENTNINDSPIHFSLTPNKEGPSGHISYPKMKGSFASSSAESKRARDDTLQDATPVKKPRSDDILRPKSTNSTNNMPPPDLSFGRGRPIPREEKGGLPKSANTSFASTANVSSVFSQGLNSFPTSTQETVPDDEPRLPRQSLSSAFTTRQPDHIQSSSEFASSSFERRMAECQEEVLNLSPGNAIPSEDIPEAEELSQDLNGYTIDDDDALLSPAEKQLKVSLDNVFPPLPTALDDAPLCVLYEITRVFLHAEVSLSEFDAPVTSGLKDYNTLWSFLKNLPPLKGKPFPERCGEEVWACALNDFQKGFYSVSFSGSLSFNESSLLQLRLDPLKLEYSHRLGRRFGHDRFAELSMPQITGRHVPPAVQRQVQKIGVDVWRGKFYDWLVDTKHPLLGRIWKPFFVKPKERTAKRREATSSEAIYRVFFFAVDGFGFVDSTLISYPNRSIGHPRISIDRLLDKIRPTCENTWQSYLKLFNRTTLGEEATSVFTSVTNIVLAVSRNQETLVLERSQIIFKDDLKENGEVMNDGAGRISPSLALKVTQKLGLSYLPSGFQARLGEAKGFWVVDHTNTGGEDWIEVYSSQQKWSPSSELNEESDDRSHRAFEVLRYSGPLKSADLNTQLLPLLMDRAKAIGRGKAMRDAIAELLRQGLKQEVEDIQVAMESPPIFKLWIRASSSGSNERLKNGAIPYRTGRPVTKEECLNVMLDSGFDPKNSLYMNKMAREVFKRKCDDLKERMCITVGRSTYAYMVPDFWGCLKENEVYIDFSSFVDNVSGFSGASLSGADVLVARCPAHFVSDIQKVKAVVKEELVGLKDVIVFPIVGNPSLAAKLSGGDYDGDIAWVCWEPTIVDNFACADVPAVPDLVLEGFLTKDSTKYEDLIRSESSLSATSLFLKKSFQFNMQPSMLGICTSYKESVCYTQGRVGSREALYLSQLLSNLVDQAKQGYEFDEERWQTFKDLIIKTNKPRQLRRKDSNWVPREPSSDIIEHLLWVAHEAINESLQELKEEGSWYDDDLVARYKMYVGERTKKNKEATKLLNDLEADLEVLKNSWTAHFARAPNDESKPEFISYVAEIYEEYRDIKPQDDNLFTRTLLCNDGSNPELSGWELLKASTLFALYNRKYVSNLVWWMGGKQLCFLKGLRAGGTGPPHLVTAAMYITGKPDPSIIRRLQDKGYGSVDDDLASVVNIYDLEDREDD